MKYKDILRINPTWKCKVFKETVKNDQAVGVSDMKCYRARKKVMDELRGFHMGQYAKLWEFYGEIRDKNPGSGALLVVDRPQLNKQLMFRRIYIYIDACKKEFVNGIRPIIGLDGCHLIGLTQGQPLAVVTYNENDIIYPFAFAIIESECKDSWQWFLQILFNDISYV